jgi:hypothetical protein
MNILYITNTNQNFAVKNIFDNIEGYERIEDNRLVVFKDFISMNKYLKQGYIVFHFVFVVYLCLFFTRLVKMVVNILLLKINGVPVWCYL